MAPRRPCTGSSLLHIALRQRIILRTVLSNSESCKTDIYTLDRRQKRNRGDPRFPDQSHLRKTAEEGRHASSPEVSHRRCPRWLNPMCPTNHSARKGYQRLQSESVVLHSRYPLPRHLPAMLAHQVDAAEGIREFSESHLLQHLPLRHLRMMTTRRLLRFGIATDSKQ
jgi:hypothetical protein